jgi:hypothetical protein
MQKKPYSRPTVTDHGSVVEKTKGRVGFSSEPIGIYLSDDDPPGTGVGSFDPAVQEEK